jgi:hypothetical protein
LVILSFILFFDAVHTIEKFRSFRKGIDRNCHFQNFSCARGAVAVVKTTVAVRSLAKSAGGPYAGRSENGRLKKGVFFL